MIYLFLFSFLSIGVCVLILDSEEDPLSRIGFGTEIEFSREITYVLMIP